MSAREALERISKMRCAQEALGTVEQVSGKYGESSRPFVPRAGESEAVAFLRRVLVCSLLMWLSIACGSTKEPPLVCEAAAEGVGDWRVAAIPSPLDYSDIATGDLTDLLCVDGECTRCTVGQLDPLTAEWTLRSADLAFTKLRSFATASPRFVLNGRALFNRDEGTWLEVEIPEEMRVSATSHWTGREFLMWGGSRTASGTIRLEPGTNMIGYYDGSLLNPETLEWRAIPAAREDAQYLWGDGGPSLASIWTSSGLFVWGTNPERTGNWGAIFDVESMQWTELGASGELPPLRIDHQLLTAGGDVYLFGGKSAQGERSRRLFRYQLGARVWTEIEVPRWADPRTGAVVDGKLVFLGECESGARYDPATDTWDALAGGGPPSLGVPRAAGSFLTVTDTFYGETESNEVWILDLRE